MATPKPATPQKSTHPVKRPTPWRKPPSMVLHGPPGVGKSSLLAHMPNPMFVYETQETGIELLIEYGQVPKPRKLEIVDTFNELVNLGQDAYKFASEGIQTLVVDSLTGMERLCFIHHCKEYFDNNWTAQGFYSYQQGPKNAAKVDWPRFLEAMNYFIDAEIAVFLIGHTQVKTFQNPEGPDFDRYIPYLDKETWAQTHKWAKAVLFYKYHYDIIEKKAAQSTKNKADKDVTRQIRTEHSPVYDAKNLMGLPPIIFAGDSPADACRAVCQAIAESVPKS